MKIITTAECVEWLDHHISSLKKQFTKTPFINPGSIPLAIRAKLLAVEVERKAPVQGYEAGIPWPMHLKAYDVYRKLYGEQKALIDLEGRNCRGGFSTGELDDWIPGWRDELSEINILKAKVKSMETKVLAADEMANLVKQGLEEIKKARYSPKPAEEARRFGIKTIEFALTNYRNAGGL